MSTHEPKPDVPSSDIAKMLDHWQDIDAILGGVTTMRDRADVFLPQFPDEAKAQYEFRVSVAKFTNIYRDIVDNLSQRPFSNKVIIADGTAGSEVLEFAEDVDGQGSTLHGFAGEVFFSSMAYGVDFVMCDYTANVPAGATRAVEKQMGARPYWVRYPASSIIAIYSETVNGKEEITHFRAWEPTCEVDGFEETTKDQIRVLKREKVGTGVLGPVVSELWHREKNADGKEVWALVDEPKTLSIEVMPIVPIATGRRLGKGWVYHPPMRDAAELQVEHFQQESALKYAKIMTAFPMLAGNGVEAPLDEDGNVLPVAVGPHRTVFAPEGSYAWIEPSANSLRFLADDIKETAHELRELGRQPLTAQSGNITVVTSAMAAGKANTAIQAWAYNLSEGLEMLLWLTTLWLKVPDTPEVVVDMDFDLSYDGDTGFPDVMALRKSRDISREAAIHEAKRRNILDRDYDPEEDLELILKELEDEARDEFEDGEDEGSTGTGSGGTNRNPGTEDGE